MPASGEGLFGGSEVRGPVTGPQEEEQDDKSPAAVVWKNAEESQGLKPQMQETIQSMRRKVPKLDSIGISSGKREPLTANDPHADGRAVDVSRINGEAVQGLETSNAPGAERTREAAANLEKWARKDSKVNQFIGPNGGWNRNDEKPKTKLIPITDKALLGGHKDHYHINVRRK